MSKLAIVAKPPAPSEDEQVDELRSAILKEEQEYSRWLDLARYPARLLVIMMKRSLVNEEIAHTAIYFDKDIDIRPENAVAQYVSVLRRTLKKFDVKVHNRMGAGWWIEEVDKAKLRGAIEHIKQNVTRPEAVVVPKYLVEKEVPLPKLYQQKYPFDAMEIGDSFTSQATRESMHKSIKIARRNNPGRNWVTRQVAGAIRIWRTK